MPENAYGYLSYLSYRFDKILSTRYYKNIVFFFLSLCSRLVYHEYVMLSTPLICAVVMHVV